MSSKDDKSELELSIISKNIRHDLDSALFHTRQAMLGFRDSNMPIAQSRMENIREMIDIQCKLFEEDVIEDQ